ncbi:MULTISPECIES: hypothetical protein [unclassified Streptomyces]|uniref:Uncharacterized protein n=1 Tax=Streptomyces sp. NBC_00060 TaxID=2975636 RepID=A0AAU2HEY4_9ACTN
MDTGQPVIEHSAARTAWEEAGTVLVPDALEPGQFEDLVKEARIEPLLANRTPKRGGRWRDHRRVIDAIA